MQLIGYGNPGRCDDGLGPAFAARVAAQNLPGIVVSTDYQLTVDHALRIAEAKRVVFVDAAMNIDAPFSFGPLQPAPSHDLASHSLDPSAVLALAATLFDAEPDAYVLAIAGQEFGTVHEGLSPVAEQNLRIAEVFFLGWLGDNEPAADLRGYADA